MELQLKVEGKRKSFGRQIRGFIINKINLFYTGLYGLYFAKSFVKLDINLNHHASTGTNDFRAACNRAARFVLEASIAGMSKALLLKANKRNLPFNEKNLGCQDCVPSHDGVQVVANSGTCEWY